jgi:hypothetical protein
MNTYDREQVQFHHSCSRHQIEGSGQLHAPAALILEKEPVVPVG